MTDGAENEHPSYRIVEFGLGTWVGRGAKKTKERGAGPYKQAGRTMRLHARVASC